MNISNLKKKFGPYSKVQENEPGNQALLKIYVPSFSIVVGKN